MSELMRQAMDTNQWTFDMLRDPDWRPDRDSYQSMRDGLVARLRTVEAERDAARTEVGKWEEAAHGGGCPYCERMLAAEARVEALSEAIQDVLNNTGGHDHWREGGAGGMCSACFRQNAATERARAALAVSGNQP